jgi:hypothetical protein
VARNSSGVIDTAGSLVFARGDEDMARGIKSSLLEELSLPLICHDGEEARGGAAAGEAGETGEKEERLDGVAGSGAAVIGAVDCASLPKTEACLGYCRKTAPNPPFARYLACFKQCCYSDADPAATPATMGGLARATATVPRRDNLIQWTSRDINITLEGEDAVGTAGGRAWGGDGAEVAEATTDDGGWGAWLGRRLVVSDRTWHHDALSHLQHAAPHDLRVRRRELRKVELTFVGRHTVAPVQVATVRSVKEVAFDPSEATHTYPIGGAATHVVARSSLTIKRVSAPMSATGAASTATTASDATTAPTDPPFAPTLPKKLTLPAPLQGRLIALCRSGAGPGDADPELAAPQAAADNGDDVDDVDDEDGIVDLYGSSVAGLLELDAALSRGHHHRTHNRHGHHQNTHRVPPHSLHAQHSEHHHHDHHNDHHHDKEVDAAAQRGKTAVRFAAARTDTTSSKPTSSATPAKPVKPAAPAATTVRPRYHNTKGVSDDELEMQEAAVSYTSTVDEMVRKADKALRRLKVFEKYVALPIVLSELKRTLPPIAFDVDNDDGDDTNNATTPSARPSSKVARVRASKADAVWRGVLGGLGGGDGGSMEEKGTVNEKLQAFTRDYNEMRTFFLKVHLSQVKLTAMLKEYVHRERGGGGGGGGGGRTHTPGGGGGGGR